MLLLKDSHIDWASEKLDDLIKADNAIIEAVDGLAAKAILKFLNANLSKHIPENYIPLVQEALDKVVEEEYDDAVGEAIDVIVELVGELDLKPGIHELVLALLNIIESVLQSLLQK